VASAPAAAAAGAGPAGGYGRGARILSIGIASTGVFSFLYFAVASHVLAPGEYGAIALLWATLFILTSVIYRPVEQLLSRTIAERIARGETGAHPLRVPLTLQASFALVFGVVVLVARDPVQDAFDGSAALYWTFVAAGVAYGASYVARGYLAGHRWFALYGGLVLFEAVGRVCFPAAVAVGLASGQTAVALGIVAAPLLSLLVVPAALARHAAPESGPARGDAARGDAAGLTLRAGAGFAVAVAAVQLAEQTLVNAAVLTTRATAGTVLAGAVFNALLITRAPLQLFQAVQTTLLPHLTGLRTTEGNDDFARTIRVTLLAVAAFAAAVALGLLAIGPWAMDLVFGEDYTYGRWGLAVVALGMGFHLAAGTLNQAALARGQAPRAAVAWLAAAALFVVWMVIPAIEDELLRAEVGYAAATALLCAALWRLYRYS
jgi:O-antigen/teichoic acid export membrane protein